MKIKKITIHKTINIDEKYGTIAGPAFILVVIGCIFTSIYIFALMVRILSNNGG